MLNGFSKELQGKEAAHYFALNLILGYSRWGVADTHSRKSILGYTVDTKAYSS
jgi:hypothetical protein